MTRTSSRSSQMKREPPTEVHMRSSLVHRQTTSPCPPSSAWSAATMMAEDDAAMTGMDTTTSHPSIHEELRRASVRSVDTNPVPTPSRTPYAGTPRQGNETPGGPAGVHALGHRTKDLVQAMDDLQQLGIERADIPIPKIVVVGNQSAGKSSLVERLSGIKVPRSSGTCTRCPLQISLSPSSDDQSEWYCKVTLQKKYSLYTSSSPDSQFGRWQADYESEDIFFCEVYNTVELEEALKRAQFATLNPGDKPQKYLNAANVEDLPVATEFSPNPIHLDITGPGLPNLSFFDLPGVISVTENESDRWLVGLVKNLVIDYINQENSLILLASSLEGDLQNSTASALVMECGAKDRTVAVLTKPDRFPPGNPLNTIQRILENKAFPVGHGYYVTKAASQLELDNNITQDEAQAAEDGFFATHPWSTNFAMYQSRFGTTNLREALSKKLIDQIVVALPSISCKLSTRLNEVEDELARYPAPPTNPLGRVLEGINHFSIAVERHVLGFHPYNDLRNAVIEANQAFREALHQQKPMFIVNTPAGYLKKPVTINLLSDDEDVPVVFTTPAKKRKIDVFNTTPLIKGLKTPSTHDTSGPVSHGKKMQQTHGAAKKRFSLLEIRETLEKMSLSDVPGETNPMALDHLRMESVSKWYIPMDVFLENVSKIFENTMNDTLEEACSQWLTTDFYKEAKQILTTFITATMAEQRTFAHRAFRLEKHKSMTMAKHMEAQEEKELAGLEHNRTSRRAFEQLQSGLSAEEKKHKLAEHMSKAENDKKLREQLGPDVFQREIKAMASVRSYYNIASLRFLDHVVQGVQAEVFVKCRDELPAQLRAGLMVESPDAQDYCKKLLTVDADREVRRLQLAKEKEALLKASERLAAIRPA